MRRVLIGIAILVFATGGALAQTPTVCIYSSDDGTACDFSSDPVGLQQFFVYLIDAPGATAVEFSAPPDRLYDWALVDIRYPGLGRDRRQLTHRGIRRFRFVSARSGAPSNHELHLERDHHAGLHLRYHRF